MYFDVDVLLNDRRVSLFPNNLNESLDSNEYKVLKNEYSDKGSLPNLIDVYKLSGSDRINTHKAAMKIANNRMNDLAELKNNLKFSKKEILDNSDNI